MTSGVQHMDIQYAGELIHIAGKSREDVVTARNNRARLSSKMHRKKIIYYKRQQRKSLTGEGVSAETGCPQAAELLPLERLKCHLGKFLL